LTGMTGVVVFGSDGFLEKRRGRRLPRSPHKTRRDVSFSCLLLRLRKARSRPSARSVRTRTDLPPTSLRTSSSRSSRRRQ
jgi:hypothetical protein